MDKKELAFRCDCFAPHYINFVYWLPTSEINGKEFKDTEELYINLTIIKKDFWTRIKECFKYLFKKNYCISYDTVILDKDKIEQLKDYINSI